MNLNSLPYAEPLTGEELVVVQQGGVWCKAQLSKLLTTTPVAITATPTAFTATTINDTDIDLAWTSSAAAFTLERSLDESSWEQIYTGATASFSDTLLQADNQYFYRVSATDTSEIQSDWAYADATTDPAP